jgi:hypothetical protein
VSDIDTALVGAVSHALNYHSIDAKLNTPDWQLAELLVPEISKHLRGETDVQIIERMTPEERAQIGREPENPSSLAHDGEG